MDRAVKLPIYPLDAFTQEHSERLCSTPEDDPFPFSHLKIWGPRAKWLLQHLLSEIGLERTDDIAIVTTSNFTYVSTCLSVTAFNFARISRVVTAATRVVIVVHEFGYVFPDIAKKCEIWRSQGIVVIEDCAHLVGLDLPEGRIGSFGDYTLVSLPKILPTRVGGLLLARRPLRFTEPSGKESDDTALGKQAAIRFLGHHRYLSAARIERHDILKEALQAKVWEPCAQAIPFATYVESEDTKREIAGVEMLATMEKNFFIIPTNPFVDIQVFSEITRAL